MTDNLSQRIIDFMSGLRPVYTGHWHEGKRGAISLEHGHIYLAPDSSEECMDGHIKVYWNSNTSHHSIVLGDHLAHMAIARYSELDAIPRSILASSEFEFMANHLRVKTGIEIDLD